MLLLKFSQCQQLKRVHLQVTISLQVWWNLEPVRCGCGTDMKIILLAGNLNQILQVTAVNASYPGPTL